MAQLGNFTHSRMANKNQIFQFISNSVSIQVHQQKGLTMAKRVFVNYYFRTKYGQGAKATAYFEEIRKEALKLGILDVHMGLVEIGDHSPSTYFSLIFESADAFGRQWGNGSEYAERSADWTALWKKMNEEPNQIMERVGSHLVYER
jgi:hypothetical protein